MKNPLFEALTRQINSYGIDPIFDQADPAKKTQIGEFINYLAETGRNMIQAYQVAIGTYPSTQYKLDYMAKMPDKIRTLAKTVGTPSQVKTITAQLDSLLTAVKTELTSFLEGSKTDKDYVEFLEGWRNALQLGFNNYELAITEIGKYVKTKDELGVPMTDDQYAILGKSINKIADAMDDQIAKNKILNQGIDKSKATKENSSFSNREDIKNYMVENFRQTGKMITFSEYNNALGKEIFEDKEARVTRRGVNALIDGCKNLKNQVNSVVVLISSRESFHEGNTGKFKSSAMNTQFADIAKQMDSILAQIEGLNRREKGKLDNLPELEDAYEKYSTLFTDLKEKYDTDYSTEYAKIKSVDIVNTAIPSVAKYIDDANASFNGLSNISLEAQAAKNAEDKKKADGAKADAAKPAATAATGEQIKSKPITQKDTAGKKNDEVKSFQEAVIKKYENDKEMIETSQYKDLKAALDKGQGGIYGKRTVAMVKYLKAGLGLKDTSGEITQELIDAINKDDIKKDAAKKDEPKAKVPESFNFGFNSKLFEFNHEAAKKATSSSSNTESKGVKKEKVKIDKSVVKDVMKEAPKTSNNSVEAQVKKGIEEFKEGWIKDAAIKELTDNLDGVKPNPDYGKNGQMAVATTFGVRFYANGAALRMFDKKLGRYNIKKNTFTSNDGDVDDLKDLVKTGIPKKYKDVVFDFKNNPKRACKKYINSTPETISILNQMWKGTYGKSLDKEFRSGLLSSASSDDDVDTFRKKFVSVLS